jgi:choloylglycine hydrolase
MAGLNFPGNAVYYDLDPRKDNITPFEFIPWILGRCAGVDEAKELLDRINLVNTDFSPQLPLSPLHWMISDGKCSIVVESRIILPWACKPLPMGL